MSMAFVNLNLFLVCLCMCEFNYPSQLCFHKPNTGLKESVQIMDKKMNILWQLCFKDIGW